MQLKHLFQSISDLSDDELMERLRDVRKRREVMRPVAKAKEARAEKKKVVKQGKAVSRVISILSLEDKKELLRS